MAKKQNDQEWSSDIVYLGQLQEQVVNICV